MTPLAFIVYLIIFMAGAWLSFVAGFLGRQFMVRSGLEGIAADLLAGAAALGLFVAAFIWWLS